MPQRAGHDARPSEIRVVIVNDSATMRAALRAALAAEPDVVVVGETGDGARAVDVVAAARPQVVLIDVVMPGTDGYAATRQIMDVAPTPIVLVSSVVNPRDIGVAMEALRSGALAVIDGLPPPTDPSYAARRMALAQLVRSMSAVQLAPRRRSNRPRPRRKTPPPLPRSPPVVAQDARVDAVGVASSAGGPSALVELLGALPREGFPPVLLVQHLARGFAVGLAEWLAQTTSQRVEVARHGELAASGRVYVAPDDRHLGLDAALRLVLSDEPPVGLFRPSGTHLLRSLARALGPRALGVILTGMGDDGAEGAVALRQAGGRVVGQDEATSVVFGMPRAAHERGGVDELLPLGEIAGWICARSGLQCRRS